MYLSSGVVEAVGGATDPVSAKPVPAKVSTVKATNNSRKKVTLQWKKVAGASGYEITRSKYKTKGYQKIATMKKGSTVKYTNSNLTKNKTYYYKIRAYRLVNGKKVYGSYSTVKAIKIKRG